MRNEMAKAQKAQEMETNEQGLTAIQGGALAAPLTPIGGEVIASDVIIPKLLLMQGISPLVMARKAGVGDIVRNTTEERLGNPESPVDIVPIMITATWLNFEVLPPQSGQTPKPAYRGMEARNARNEHDPWSYNGPNGVPFIRKKAISLFALVPADVAAYEAEVTRALAAGEAPDLNRTIMPVVVTFQSTSFKHGGKKIATLFKNVQVQAAKFPGLTPYMYTAGLTCREEKNQKGTFYVWDLNPPKPLKDKAVLEEAKLWAGRLATTAFKVAEGDEVMEEDNGPRSTGSGVSEMEV